MYARRRNAPEVSYMGIVRKYIEGKDHLSEGSLPRGMQPFARMLVLYNLCYSLNYDFMLGEIISIVKQLGNDLVSNLILSFIGVEKKFEKSVKLYRPLPPDIKHNGANELKRCIQDPKSPLIKKFALLFDELRISGKRYTTDKHKAHAQGIIEECTSRCSFILFSPEFILFPLERGKI